MPTWADAAGPGIWNPSPQTPRGSTTGTRSRLRRVRPVDPTNLTRTFTALLRKAALRRIRVHDLRHSTAALHLEQGVELVVIKELLGHAHIGFTATVYAHVRLHLQRQAIDTLGASSARPTPRTTRPPQPLPSKPGWGGGRERARDRAPA
ncbi:tyrosine-type recombinase/integrase, partial [Streptomyces sp. NPDC059398]|uniref:tyrosine-type recombinase/integrase n=1 Tax=Streptomyces sp. NPDC059398 TaxID=3346820 RepID=UPI00367F3DF4